MTVLLRMLSAALVGLALMLPASAAPIYFDFGSNATPTPGNYNNIDHTQAPILNAIDATGAATGIGLATSGFNEIGPNTNGTTTPGGAAAAFAAEAAQDNIFGHSVNFNAPGPRPLGTLEFTGLNASLAYDLTFFASRLGVTDNRQTQYAVSGSNIGTGLLDASNNTDNVAVVSGIKPTATGTIIVEVTKGQANTNTSGFFYIGALRLNAVPEPACILLFLFSSVWLTSMRRSAHRGTR